MNFLTVKQIMIYVNIRFPENHRGRCLPFDKSD